MLAAKLRCISTVEEEDGDDDADAARPRRLTDRASADAIVSESLGSKAVW